MREFNKPVLLGFSRTVQVSGPDHAAEFVRACLREKFTFARLNMLLMLERVATWEDVEEARHALEAWVSAERAADDLALAGA